MNTRDKGHFMPLKKMPVKKMPVKKMIAMFGLMLVWAGAGLGGNAHADTTMRIMVFGDSLVAGHGLPQDQAFPNVLEDRLRTNGHNVALLNAGVSGDTTAGGRARLEWSLADNPDAVIIVLGGNDLLRGLDPAATKENLAAILDRLAQADIPVLLAGMQAPRNLGAEFAAEFDQAYRDLGARDGVVFYPFFLEGVALRSEFNQPDGLHPNLAGVTEITDRILPYAEQLIQAQ